MTAKRAKLTLGPLMFHWPVEKRRDFYYRIADEAPVDTVHLGEVVCSKRAPFFEPIMAEVTERLHRAGKEVVLSTLALVTSERELKAIRDYCNAGFLVEANDVSAIHALAGRPFVVGPLVNLFNEGSLATVAAMGAVRASPPPEVSLAGIKALVTACPGVDIEVPVFGRQTLSIAGRCYHARSRGLHQDGCQFACQTDADGLAVETLTGQPILTVNGTSTMSHGYVALGAEVSELREAGVSRWRLSPQDVDMVAVAGLYRDLVDGRITAPGLLASLHMLTGDTPFVNGYMHRREGLAWVE